MKTNDLVEMFYGCKVCGYLAKSGAGLKGHVQLAHGERASGKAELTRIGDEVAKLREDLIPMLTRLSDPDGAKELASEFRELNGHMRALRAQREVTTSRSGQLLPVAIRSRSSVQRDVALTEHMPSAHPNDDLGRDLLIVGGLLLAGILAGSVLDLALNKTTK